MADDDFVLVEAAVLVLLPDDVVLPGVQFKTNHYSPHRTTTTTTTIGTCGREIKCGKIGPCAATDD